MSVLPTAQGRELLTIAFGDRNVAAAVNRTNRRTLRIAVRSNGDVDVFVPSDAEWSEIERRILRRRAWVFKQLDALDRASVTTPDRRFVSGESHLLLGRQYRLSIEPSATPEVRIEGGRLLILARDVDDAAHCRRLLTAFHRIRARDVFSERLEELMPPFRRRGLQTPQLIVRSMLKRWGSYTASGRVALNLDLVRASPNLIDYVICHELAHAFYPDHGKQWRELLESTIPDWKIRKARLEAELR